MCQVLEQLLAQGALGLSLGLIYPPGSFCNTNELYALAKVVADADKILAVHLRDEGRNIFHALDEIIDVAARTGVRLQISHLKLMGATQMGNADELLERLDQARAQGIQISCDQYPYTASNTTLCAILPLWAMDGGTDALLQRLDNPAQWEQIITDGTPKLTERGGPTRIIIGQTGNHYPELEGKSLEEAAAHLGLPIWEAIRQLLLRTKTSTSCVYHSMDPGDMLTIMVRPDIATASDGVAYDLSNLPGRPHPRSTSTFPRFLRIVREEKLMPLEDAIYKITALPAKLIGLGDQIGQVKEDFPADLTIFDSDKISDQATFEDPSQTPTGIHAVLVNGVPVLQNGVLSNSRPGLFYSG